MSPLTPEQRSELAAAVVVDFPLRGEDWVAVNSPADRIPSHGVDILGQRYAFDFVRVDGRRPGFHPRSPDRRERRGRRSVPERSGSAG